MTDAVPSEREALEKALEALTATNNAQRFQEFAVADRLRINAIKTLTEALASPPHFKMTTNQTAAPVETIPTEFQILAITTAYEQGVGKGHQGVASNPYVNGYCADAWALGFDEGKEQKSRQSTPASAGAVQ